MKETTTAHIFRLVWRFLVLVMIVSSLAVVRPAAGSERLSVWVGIMPQAYFVERIGGDFVDIGVLIRPGQSHEMYDPTPKDIAQLSKSDIYFEAGLPFEQRLVEKITAMNPRFDPVNVKQGITLRQSEPGHEHGVAGDEGPDPHTWLDPTLVKIEARHICDALKRLDPTHATEFETNYTAFAGDLDRADSTIAAILAPFAGQVIYVYHPAYGYFTDRYHLRQVAVELEGKEPGAEQLGTLIGQARRDKAGTVFVQREYSEKTAEAVAREIGARVVILDPMAREYLDNITQMATVIRDELSRRDAGK
ncbi:MAG: zinc ABC transporter substrate-binding protein [candidate division Zixibacteria bacterium]|nr:zinc ABC transporter substrate-binding protein [candidate division Zixibacteria bacterium]